MSLVGPTGDLGINEKHFKTLSLDESRSPDFDLFSDQEEYSEEEVAEIIAETMEQYMSKTRADYESGVSRPKIEDKENFELKGQFLKELLLFYNGLDVPTRQILNSRGAIPLKTDANAKVAIQEMAEYSQNGTMEHLGPKVSTTPKIAHSRKKGKPSKKLTTLNLVHLFKEGDIKQLLWDSTKGTMQTLPKRHEENSNFIKEIRASMDAAIRNQGASIKTLEIQIRQMSKVIQERRFGSLSSSTETNPRDHVMLISTIVEADASSIHQAYSYGASHINKSIPQKEKDPGSFTLPCYINNVCFDNTLADLGANVSVMPLSTYLNLGLGELAYTKLTVELADRTMKYPKGIVENVLVGIGKFVFPVDFIILDIPEDVKVPLILRRPFFSTAHAKIDVFKRKIVGVLKLLQVNTASSRLILLVKT
ncbi:hypothetical protein Tco_0745482 [Tanacetum coccineum]